LFEEVCEKYVAFKEHQVLVNEGTNQK